MWQSRLTNQLNTSFWPTGQRSGWLAHWLTNWPTDSLAERWSIILIDNNEFTVDQISQSHTFKSIVKVEKVAWLHSFQSFELSENDFDYWLINMMHDCKLVWGEAGQRAPNWWFQCHTFIFILSFFLVTCMRLYIPFCPSVDWSVGWSYFTFLWFYFYDSTTLA